jgi:hypothetical protein
LLCRGTRERFNALQRVAAMHSNFNDLKTKTMDITAEKYYDDNLENYNLLNKIDPMTAKQAMEMMEAYHQAKLKLLGIGDVVNRRELLLDFADYSEIDKTSQTTDECVDNYLDSIK